MGVQPDNELIVKLALAVIIGGAIGLERELRSKSAGFRTLMLICLGATLFTIFSQLIGKTGSPDRIASNVVVGIGFMGAGVIFKSYNRVNGITTAAAIWLVAALGVGIGCGYYMASVLGGLLVLTILFLFSFLDNALDNVNQLREYKITFPYEQDNEHKYEELMREFGLRIKSRVQNKTGNIITGTWMVGGSKKKHHSFIDKVLRDASVTEFAF
jgi:putative Mg2+ transporter-C (MgtC) family protein